jgi:NAD(P)-dependent dehydrogenase (short-subunit alcohol dehydrogenase family)
MTGNKVAIITGASKGIGKAIALGLAKRNYQTILTGRNRDDLEIISRQITASEGLTPDVFAFDITDAAALKNFTAKVISKHAQIDVLVNNAGVYFDGTLDLERDKFQKMLDTNLTAQHQMLQQVVPVMKRQKSGYIFNVASRSGKVGFAQSGAYSASKFGMVGLSEALYRELNPLGIRVTALCPGWVNTQMAFQADTPLPAEQMIQPDDLLKTIDWLLSLSPGACVKEVVIETPFSIS